MLKIVNLDVRSPIRALKRTINMGKYYNVEMSTNDIFKCICGRAIVDEVLPNGTTIRLDLNNYRNDHKASLVKKEEKKETPVSIPVAEDPKPVEDKVEEPVAPVVEETVVEEKEEPAIVETETIKDESVIEEDKVEEAVAPVVEETVVEEKKEEVKPDAPKNNNKNTTKRPNKKK